MAKWVFIFLFPVTAFADTVIVDSDSRSKFFTAEWASFAITGAIHPIEDNLLKKNDWIKLQEKIRSQKNTIKSVTYKEIKQ
jgi:hypothetical protein